MKLPVKVKERMVQSFQVLQPGHTVGQARELLEQGEDEYAVLITEGGEPLSLVTEWQLRMVTDENKLLKDILSALPEVIAIEHSCTMDQLLDDLSSALMGGPDIAGVAVLEDGNVTGVVPRRVIKDYARMRIRGATRSGGGLEGDHTSNARVYACPNGDFEQPVPFYNRFDPPKCPNHKILLVRKS
jgi:CBS domain-containing protein